MIDLTEPDTLPDTLSATTVIKGPPDNNGYWIAFAPSNVKKIISDLQELSCSWVAPRVILKGPTIEQSMVDLIEDLKAANFKVFPWKYCVPGDLDASKVFTQLVEIGCDGYIIDAEEEFEVGKQREAAKTLAGKIREIVKDSWLAHAPFALPRWHDNFPYCEFAQVCDAVMPQLYAWEFNDSGYKYWIPKYEEQWLEFEQNYPEAVKPRLAIGCSYRPKERVLGGKPTVLAPLDPMIVAKDISDYCEYFGGGLYTYEAMSAETFKDLVHIRRDDANG